MPDVERISVEDARRRAAEGALLACGYEDETKCQRIRLEGALTFGELQRRLDSLSPSQEIILYCA